jgi:hypothetical protein
MRWACNVVMRNYHYEFTPFEGENLIDRPLNGRFLVPIIQLRDQSFVIPNDPAVCLIEFMTAHVYARDIGRVFCFAGIPVFDPRGKIRVYCPAKSAENVLEAFELSIESISLYADHRNISKIANCIGAVKYVLDGDAIVIDGTRRYLLPEGSNLL